MSEGYLGLPPYYVESSDPLTPNLQLCLKGMDAIIAEDFVLIDSAFGSITATIKVNGATVPPIPNFNNTTPAAPAGKTNVIWQVSGSNISAYYTTGGGGGAVTSVFGRVGDVVAEANDYSNVTDLNLGDGSSGIMFSTASGSINIFDSNSNFIDLNDGANPGISIGSSAGDRIQFFNFPRSLKLSGLGGNFIIDTNGYTFQSLAGASTAVATLDLNGVLGRGPDVSSFGFPTNVVTKTANYNAVAGDFVKCDTSGGGFTVTLPLSASNSKSNICVKKISSDTNVLTISRSGADNIDGQTTQLITQQNTAVLMAADGTSEWMVY